MGLFVRHVKNICVPITNIKSFIYALSRYFPQKFSKRKVAQPFCYIVLGKAQLEQWFFYPSVAPYSCMLDPYSELHMKFSILFCLVFS